jgi:hypothetical protein
MRILNREVEKVRERKRNRTIYAEDALRGEFLRDRSGNPAGKAGELKRIAGLKDYPRLNIPLAFPVKPLYNFSKFYIVEADPWALGLRISPKGRECRFPRFPM